MVSDREIQDTVSLMVENLAIVYIARYKLTYDENKRKKIIKKYKLLFETYLFLRQVLDIKQDDSLLEWLEDFIKEKEIER